MPAFLVHGVPDTHHLWDKVRARLARRDVLAPNLPGFGMPTPTGFRPVKEPYVAPRFAERLAKRVRGQLVFLEGCGHWWPLERPAEAATALERFWSAPDRT